MEEMTERLDDFLVTPLEKQVHDYLSVPVEDREKFTISSQSGAIWALRKLKKITNEQKEIADTAAEEIGRIRTWQSGEEKRLQGEMAYFEGLLTDYHRRLLEDNPKAKTVKLPHGVLKARAQQPEFVRDESALLTWIKAQRPEFVVTKESADWAGLKKIAVAAGSSLVDPASGEIIGGVTVVERPDKFSVEVD